MSQYLLDKRDVEFTLFEHLKIEELLKLERYSEFSREIFEMVLNEGHKFSLEKLAPSNEEADAIGARFENGQVTVPQAYHTIHKDFCESGWFAPVHNPEYGGQGLPNVIGVALIEMFVAANSSYMFIPGLSVAAAHLIEVFGTDSDKALYVERMYCGEWAGTMCLTEPQAGSALGDLTTTAVPVEGEDYYLIKGNKIFISAGDQDITDNVIHLVIARVPGDPAGSRGISLFIVPKLRVGADGTIGESNDMRVTGIEEKMGIHASPTCSLSFGDEGQCRGYLVGERCRGLQYMFQMMNEARLVTGLQGVAIGNAAFQAALAYAKERAQGPKVTDRSADAKSVAIIEHPDVRRNLMTMKAYGEAIRAMLFNTAYLSDVALYGNDEVEKTKSQDMLDLLTPICKAYATDVGFKMTELAMQVHGGYGYIKEYGIEQQMRDVKIASLYEGTNGIQALDLLGRKMRLKNGALFMTWLQDTNEFLESIKDDGVLGGLVKDVEAAKNALGEAAFSFVSTGMSDPEYPLLHATPFLRMFGLVESARLLLEQANIAKQRLAQLWETRGVESSDATAREQLVQENDAARYYENKIQTAKFFVYQILPEARAILKSIQSSDRSALEVRF
ncbi:MAG: acyl-CoA dehydrogenase [Bradymonadaceae bacterium]|nr:acyl-CoA dehydrogenase [Lujinxingiaceae bacterium]